MKIKQIKSPQSLIKNYSEKVEFIKQLRTTVGYAKKTLNNGACEPLTLVLADIISTDTKDLIEKIQRLQEMFLIWFLNKNPNKPTLFDEAKYGTWTNFSYKYITGSSKNLILQRAFIKEIETVQILLKEGIILCGNLIWGIDSIGMPPLHSFSIIGTKENNLIIVGDLNEKMSIFKGLIKENIGTKEEKIIENIGLSEIDLNRIVATIPINNFNKQGTFTGNILSDYFIKNKGEPKGWRYPLFKLLSIK